MKTENTFFRKLFGSKNQPSQSTGSTPVRITSYSQPHVLRQRMKEEKMTHGETITANISPVRLETAYDKMILYFCPMRSIEVIRTVSAGDGAHLPEEARVEGLTVPKGQKGGYYTLKNVVISSNGAMVVKATPETVWEEVKAETC